MTNMSETDGVMHFNDYGDGGGSTLEGDADSSSGSGESTKSSRSKTCKRWLKLNLLVIFIIVGICAGIGLGVGMRPYNLSKREQMYFQFPGELLMRMLKAMVIPLITSSLIAGLGGLDSRASGKMGLWTVLYYVVTTVIAVLLGILLVMTIKPGAGYSGTDEPGEAESQNIADSFLDLLRNIFPDNIVEACFRNAKTNQLMVDQEYNVTNWTNDTSECPEVTPDPQLGGCNVTRVQVETSEDFKVVKNEGMNILGLVVFSIAMGIATSALGEDGRPLYLFAHAVAEASMKLVTVIIWYSPIGIMFLVAAEIIGMEDPMESLQALGLYIATVISGLLIHGFIIVPLLYLAIVRKNPLVYMAGIAQAMFTALGTASSSATLPVSYKCLERNIQLDQRVTRFVLPVGAVINMDGTALYEAVSAIFIAQSLGLDLSAANVITISLTATLASIGAASMPGAGLITLIIVLESIGLPAEEVTKVLAVDWLLDRVRTMVNVEGDCFASGVVAHLSRKTLAEMTRLDQEKEEQEARQLAENLEMATAQDSFLKPSLTNAHATDGGLNKYGPDGAPYVIALPPAYGSHPVVSTAL